MQDFDMTLLISVTILFFIERILGLCARRARERTHRGLIQIKVPKYTTMNFKRIYKILEHTRKISNPLRILLEIDHLYHFQPFLYLILTFLINTF
jgi:hypothetical protein